MGKIITVSRRFGSGGRELGRRIAEYLDWGYYDKEIITHIIAEQGLDENYIDEMLGHDSWRSDSVSRSFAFQPKQDLSIELLVKEREVIEKIAAKGENCVFVGRNADLYLASMNPFSIFVYASKEARMARCRANMQEGEKLKDRDLKKRIRAVDKGRIAANELVGGSSWGEKGSYQLLVNTTDWEIKELAPAVAGYALKWFERPQWIAGQE